MRQESGTLVMLGMTAVGALVLMYLMYQPQPGAAAGDDDDSEPPPPPRNFTVEQLHVSTRAGRKACAWFWFFCHAAWPLVAATTKGSVRASKAGGLVSV